MNQDATAPGAPTRYVTDTTGNFLSTAARNELNRELQAYERRTKHQVVVWIADHWPGRPSETIEDCCLRLFNAWGIGRKTSDDGVVLFVFAKDDVRRIQVGLGLESALTDRECVLILKKTVVPLIHAVKRDQAIRDGVGAILAEIDAYDRDREP